MISVHFNREFYQNTFNMYSWTKSYHTGKDIWLTENPFTTFTVIKFQSNIDLGVWRLDDYYISIFSSLLIQPFDRDFLINPHNYINTISKGILLLLSWWPLSFVFLVFWLPVLTLISPTIPQITFSTFTSIDILESNKKYWSQPSKKVLRNSLQYKKIKMNSYLSIYISVSSLS